MTTKAELERVLRGVPRLPCGLCVQCRRTQPRFCTQRVADYPALAQAVQAIHVANPGVHVTDVINERDALRAEVERLKEKYDLAQWSDDELMNLLPEIYNECEGRELTFAFICQKCGAAK